MPISKKISVLAMNKNVKAFFSSPEPKAQVSFYVQNLSVVRPC